MRYALAAQRRDRLKQRQRKLSEAAKHPSAEQKQENSGCQKLRHIRERDLLNLCCDLHDADNETNNQRSQHDGPANNNGGPQKLVEQKESAISTHVVPPVANSHRPRASP